MSIQTSQLELQWRDRSGSGERTAYRYLDFVVGGQSLLQLLRANLIGSLGWLNSDYEHLNSGYEYDLIAQLLLQAPSNLRTGRYLLYVCSECGDISCGAVTIAIEETPSHFIWRDFGYENDYEDIIHSLDQYASIGPFYFNKFRYKRVFEAYLKHIED